MFIVNVTKLYFKKAFSITRNFTVNGNDRIYKNIEHFLKVKLNILKCIYYYVLTLF